MSWRFRFGTGCILSIFKDGHSAVVKSTDLLPEGAQALLVRCLMYRQHLLHLPQRVQQIVSGRTLLSRRFFDLMKTHH